MSLLLSYVVMTLNVTVAVVCCDDVERHCWRWCGFAAPMFIKALPDVVEVERGDDMRVDCLLKEGDDTPADDLTSATGMKQVRVLSVQ